MDQWGPGRYTEQVSGVVFLLHLEASDTLPYPWTDDVPSGSFLKSGTIRFGDGGLKLGPIPVLISDLV